VGWGRCHWCEVKKIRVLAEMPVHSEQSSQFRQIEQPLGLKVGVAIAGLALIGLELWWFLIYVGLAEKVVFNADRESINNACKWKQ
jgi:plastocyanin domain-containing protein